MRRTLDEALDPDIALACERIIRVVQAASPVLGSIEPPTNMEKRLEKRIREAVPPPVPVTPIPPDDPHNSYTIETSGVQEEFIGGAVRDTQEGKPRYDLIPILGLRRVAIHYGSGARHYKEWNWALGIKFSRMMASLLRHAFARMCGSKKEDHLAAIVFNALGMMHFEETNRPELDDLPPWLPKLIRNQGGLEEKS